MAPRRRKQPIPEARAFSPHPKDAEHVRRAFEEHAKHPKGGVLVKLDELRSWAETGEWSDA